MKEKETIRGWDIPKRDLTEEEASREITLERFQEWHEEAGEDFIDYHSFGDPKVFAGWVMGKYPLRSKEILDLLNNKQHVSIQCIQSDFYRDDEGEEAHNLFYKDYAEFINLTTISKRNVNEILIILTEHYKRTDVD